MANICTFGIEVIGDPCQVQALKQFVERGVEKIPEAQFEKYVLRIDQLYHDLQEGDHEFIWLDDSQPGLPNEKVFVDADGLFWFNSDRSRMMLHGTSKWAPPGALVERLSRAYPDLAFTFGGTTEHEISENWTCKGGVSKCEWYVQQDILADKEMWHVRDGKPVRPLVWIDTAQEEPTAMEGKRNDIIH
jgi:hypothetical protein